MESNKDEALKCLAIAQKHRDSSNFSAARKFARKSISLFATPEAEKFLASIEAAAANSGPSVSPSNGDAGQSPNGSAQASSSATETHPSISGSRQRSTNADGSGGKNGGKREYSAEQLKVVKRVKACKVTEYYEILEVKRDCEEIEIKKAYRKVRPCMIPGVQ